MVKELLLVWTSIENQADICMSCSKNGHICIEETEIAWKWVHMQIEFTTLFLNVTSKIFCLDTSQKIRSIFSNFTDCKTHKLTRKTFRKMEFGTSQFLFWTSNKGSNPPYILFGITLLEEEATFSLNQHRKSSRGSSK